MPSIPVPLWAFILLLLPLGFSLLLFIMFGISELIEHISVRRFRKKNKGNYHE